MIRHSTFLFLALSLNACSKSEPSGGSAPADDATTTIEQKAKEEVAAAVTNNLPADVADVAEAAAKAGTAPTGLNGQPVDVCAMLPKEDAEAVLGPLLMGPKSGKPQGSLLGECTFMSKKNVVAMVSARPAGEFADTVKLSSKNAPAKAVAALGSEASSTQYGLMIKLADKPYFITVLAGPMGKMDHDTSLAVGKKLKL